MDPYGDHYRKVLSPLDKVPLKKREAGAPDASSKVIVAHVNTEKRVGNSLDPKGKPTGEPTLVDHLTDLRKQIIKSVAVFSFFFFTVFGTINIWFPYVTRGHELIVLGPLEVVKFYMSISTALAFGLSLPFLCHFIWGFVKPGLNERENSFLSFYSPVMLLLFLGGIAFGYFVVNPLSYNFLVSLGAMNFSVMVSAQEYASFLLMTTVPLGLLFELPIVALFLATIGLLTAESMKKVRKWSYLSLTVVSALITPPDFISQLIVLIPMVLLYEGSIYIVRYSERRSLAAS